MEAIKSKRSQDPKAKRDLKRKKESITVIDANAPAGRCIRAMKTIIDVLGDESYESHFGQ